MAQNAETIISQRGGRLLIIDKYLFRIVRIEPINFHGGGGVTYWRCNTVGCDAKARTDIGPVRVTEAPNVALHLHCNDATEIGRRQFKDAIKQS